jgi:hypothetical protein
MDCSAGINPAVISPTKLATNQRTSCSIIKQIKSSEPATQQLSRLTVWTLGREPHPNRRRPNKATDNNNRGNLDSLPIATASVSLEDTSRKSCTNQYKGARIHSILAYQQANPIRENKIKQSQHQRDDPRTCPVASHSSNKPHKHRTRSLQLQASKLVNKPTIHKSRTAAPVEQHARGPYSWGESLTHPDPFTKQSREAIHPYTPADQTSAPQQCLDCY